MSRERASGIGATRATRWDRPFWFGGVLLVSSAAISWWFAIRNLPLPDEGAVLTAASKILRGGVFYRDIDAYPFPGAYYLVALAMAIFGEHLSVARALAGAVYCGIVLSLYLAALQILDRRRAALFGLSLLSFKFLSWPAFSIYIYADVALLFACCAIALLLAHRFRGASRQVVLAGLCVGLSFTCKQSLGIYLTAAAVAVLALPGFFLRQPRERPASAGPELLAFGAGFALAITPMLAYFAWHGVLGTMLDSGLVRPFTGYLPTSGISFVEALRWWELGSMRGHAASQYMVHQYWHLLMMNRLPGEAWYSAYWLAGEIFSRAVYTSIPLTFLVSFGSWLRALRERHATRQQSRAYLLAQLGFAVVLSAFPRADHFHVFGVYPVVLLLLFALTQPGVALGRGRLGRIPFGLEAGAVALLLAVSVGLAITSASFLSYRLQLERADVYVFPDQAWMKPMIEEITRELRPGERLFVYGHEAHWYFLTGHFYPWQFSQLYPGQAGGDGGRALAELLERDPPSTVLRGVMEWPGVPEVRSYAPLLEDYIHRNYCREDDFFERHPSPTNEPPKRWVIQVLRREFAPSPSTEFVRSCVDAPH